MGGPVTISEMMITNLRVILSQFDLESNAIQRVQPPRIRMTLSTLIQNLCSMSIVDSLSTSLSYLYAMTRCSLRLARITPVGAPDPLNPSNSVVHILNLVRTLIPQIGTYDFFLSGDGECDKSLLSVGGNLADQREDVFNRVGLRNMGPS